MNSLFSLVVVWWWWSSSSSVVVVAVVIFSLAPCVPESPPMRTCLFHLVSRQKSREFREAAPATTPAPAPASAGGGSHEHVREAEEMLHDVCQRWCTSWWKRGLFLRVRTIHGDK